MKNVSSKKTQTGAKTVEGIGATRAKDTTIEEMQALTNCKKNRTCMKVYKQQKVQLLQRNYAALHYRLEI